MQRKSSKSLALCQKIVSADVLLVQLPINLVPRSLSLFGRLEHLVKSVSCVRNVTQHNSACSTFVCSKRFQRAKNENRKRAIFARWKRWLRTLRIAQYGSLCCYKCQYSISLTIFSNIISSYKFLKDKTEVNNICACSKVVEVLVPKWYHVWAGAYCSLLGAVYM